MTIFLSYAREDQVVATEIAQALKNNYDTVFFDQDSLPPGSDFASRIRTAIDSSDRLVFLTSRSSLSPESFVQLELDQVKKIWPVPTGRVWPVLLDQTIPVGEIDPYLRSVNMITPQANVAHRVAAEIDSSRRVGRFCRLATMAAFASLALLVALWGAHYAAQQRPVLTFISPALAGHYLGTSNVILPARMHNAGSKRVVLRNFRAHLTGPDGKKQNLFYEGTLARSAQVFIDPQLQFYQLDPGATYNFELSFLKLDDSQRRRFEKIYKTATENRELMSQSAQWSQDRKVIPEDQSSDLATASQRLFRWTPGRWDLSVSYSLDETSHKTNTSFNISKDDIDTMKVIFRFYGTGAGVFSNWRFLGPASHVQVDLIDTTNQDAAKN